MSATAVKLRKGYLDAPTGQVHYVTFGEGDPLLLLHQSPSTYQQFQAAFPYLERAGMRVIAIDTPGYGASDVPTDKPSIEMYASVVPSVLDHFGIEKTSVLGHHTGACTACEVAATYPERVIKVILNGTPYYRENERQNHLANWHREKPEPQHDGSHLLDPWTRRLRISIGYTDLEAMTRTVVEMLTVRDREWYGFWAAFNYNMMERTKDIKVPAMILTNTGEDLYGLSKRAQRHNPDFAFVELEGGTHDIVDEQPEAWTNAVVSFLRS